MADRRPLIQESSDLSESSDNTPGLPSLGFSNNSHSLGLASPPSARSNHVRYQSDITAVSRNTPSIVQEEDEEEITDNFQGGKESGLGIAASSPAPQTARRVSIQPIPRRAVGPGPKSPPTKSPGTFSPATPGDQYFGNFPKSSAESTPDLRRDRFSPEVGRASPDVGSYEEFRHGILKNAKQSNTSVNDFENYIHASDTEGLRASGGAAPSIKSAYENDFHPIHECPTRKDFYHPKLTWLNMSIFFICIFSCIFSGIFLALAIRGPHYGRHITSHGPITPADAILITTVMAKVIELSFVTAFVAFLGQVLSRRAFMKEHGRGVTLSELSMWRWVVQPGTLLTHPEAAKYAGLSFLGILSLLSTVLATLYSSAAAAMVQPMLRDGNWDNGLVLAGRVKSDFANINYIKDMCESPIRYDEEKGGTCVQLQHAGQGYQNFQFFLKSWDLSARNGDGKSELNLRPQGIGLLHENTTVLGQWINVVDTTKVSKEYGRVINNITMAMPHSGIFAAARDQRNGILQPVELNSEGTYSLRASVPSPIVNVLCANMNEDELAPIVYNKWPNAEEDITSWLAPSSPVRAHATTKNTTAVDEIFGWDTNDNTSTINWPPVFGKLPIPFNTIMNHTSSQWGRPAIYLLGQGGPADIAGDGTGIYSLCKIQVSVIAGCSTRHNVTGSGGTMEALCDPKDKMSFVETGEEPSKYEQGVANWRDIGTDWANSLSLGTGLMDANASTSRLLTQLIILPEDPEPATFKADLSKALPSIAEALAVLSGSTLLLSMVDTPFVTFWNYTHPALDEYQTQYFKASLKAQQYASGGTPGASRAWIIILALVFAMNIFVLVYFVLHRGLVTDFSEPPNLFALAVNSPPSHVLAGSCGGGPQGKQYMVNWFVNHEGSHLYMEPGEKTHLLAGHGHGHGHGHAHVHGSHDDDGDGRIHGAAPRVVKGASGGGGVVAEVTEKMKRGLGIRRQRMASSRLRSGSGAAEGLRPSSMQTTMARPGGMEPPEFEMEDGASRTSRAYQKLAKRRSML